MVTYLKGGKFLAKLVMIIDRSDIAGAVLNILLSVPLSQLCLQRYQDEIVNN